VGHTVRTTEDEGWSGLENGDLLFAAEQAGFEIVLTADRRIRYQQPARRPSKSFSGT
jgi:hypothetical protein